MNRTLKSLALAAGIAALPLAHAAGFGDSEIEPHFRAKIMKEKAKQNVQAAQSFDFRGSQEPDAQCGSQNIGNINTNGRIGTAPREVFIFAPNSINVVSGRGCQ